MAYDDDSRKVGVEWFDYGFDERQAPDEPEADSVEQDRSLQEKKAAFSRFLQLVNGSEARPKTIGMRSILLEYLLDGSACQTQKELAERLGITEARVSQILTKLEPELDRILRG